MDKFVKGENEMWEMPAKERIQTRIVSASAVKRELDLLSVCPTTHLKTFGQKRNTHKLLRSNHPYYRNVQNISGENLRLLNSKILSIFGSTSATSVNAHFLQCRVSRFRACLTDCDLQSQLHCYSFWAEFHKIGSRQHQVFYYWWVGLFI